MPAGYSGTPLAKKHGIKEGHRLALIGASKGWGIEGLSPGVTERRADSEKGTDVTIAFFRALARLAVSAPKLGRWDT